MSGISNIFGGSGISPEGGVSPSQMSYGLWGQHEGELANASLFGNTGTGQSTMSTFADAGSVAGGIQQLAGMSQADTSAMQNYANQQKAQLQGQIGGLGSALGGSTGGTSGSSF
jgi:hypothetical protein